MQSPRFNTQGPSSTQPPPDPRLQATVSSVHVRPPSPVRGTPAFPLPQLPLAGTQPTTANGGDRRGSPAPPFPMPQRHGTTPNEAITPPLLHPLRTVQSDSAISSRPPSSLSHLNHPAGSSEKPDYVAAAEGRALLETLVYPEGEIPVLDKEDGSLTMLIHSGSLLTQKYDSDPWWDLCSRGILCADGFGALLNSHFLVLKEEPSPRGTTRRSHVARPIPLESLRLASFNDESEVRKEARGFFKSVGSCFRSLPTEDVYPFTVYHVAAKITRRHTIYTKTATERNRWHTALVNAIDKRKGEQDLKMLYAPQTLNDGFFRIPPRIQFNREAHYTGRTVCAAGFSLQGEGYIAVGCTRGIYVSRRTTNYAFRRVLEYNEPISIVAIPEFNKFIVHCESALYSYPLDVVVSASQGDATTLNLDKSMERLVEEHGDISFVKAGRVVDQTFIIYAAKSSKSSKETQVYVLELSRQAGNPQAPAEYKLLGSSVDIPEEPHDAAFFPDKKAVICAPKAIYIAEVMNDSKSSPTVIPDLPNSKRDAKTLQVVPKEKGDTPKILELVGKGNILGMVTYDNDILLIYEDFGCFVNKSGKPARSSYYVEWERRASAHTRHGPHLLLFSPGYIEMRLLRSGLIERVMLVAAMAGGTEDDGGRLEKLVELVYYGN
ncbi:CNH domain-containing protein [Russula compacta]|nr:CNH domain-containing protein [Russula compacta]